jgi:maltose/moltooligosaccharide transporter
LHTLCPFPDLNKTIAMAGATFIASKSSKKKPLLSFWQIWNISFGFLGVQIGYSLQNANTSRILSAIGADPHHLSLFWLAAPFAGLIVQPIVGGSSDKTWTRLGRRIPFILGGSIVSTAAMFFMPNSEHFATLIPALAFGAVMLLLMDTSFNVTMQPFRALVSDMLPEEQKTKGYAVQSFLINVGAVVGSLLPYVLTSLGVANEPGLGEKVAPTVIWAFYFGGAVLLITVVWTAFKTREYPPAEYAKYNDLQESDTEKVGFGTLLKNIPATMWQLSVTQFFSWFSLFLMWVYTTQAIAQHVYGTSDAHSKEYNDAGNWVGVLFAAYSVFAALYSLVITPITKRIGRLNTYMISLIAGGIGLLSMVFIHDKYVLILSMVGIGIGWAAILAMPYSILAGALPPKQTGVYMGIFNATITIPQIGAGFLGGVILTAVGNQAIWVVGIAGISMIIAGLLARVAIKNVH